MDKGLNKKIEVTYLGLIKEAVGVSKEEVFIPQGASVKELFETLMEQHKGLMPRLFGKNRSTLQPKVKVLLDDKDINEMEGLDTPLQNFSRVTLVEFKLLGGG